MNEHDGLAERFETHRSHLRAVAYRMLGSLTEADDAVQDAWLDLARSGADDVENLRGWLTTAVTRVCLKMLRSRRTRREEPVGVRVPDPVVSRVDDADPEHEVLVADSMGLAMLVVLDALAPAERVAFVLHDAFAVPFDRIAPIVGRTPAAARQLASRARRRVHEATPVPDADLASQRAVVDAFLSASRRGDFEALLAVLDPDVVFRSDGGAGRTGASALIRGAPAVAGRASAFSRLAARTRPVLVNGAAGIVAFDPRGRVFAVLGFVVARGKIVAISALADPARLGRLDLAALEG